MGFAGIKPIMWALCSVSYLLVYCITIYHWTYSENGPYIYLPCVLLQIILWKKNDYYKQQLFMVTFWSQLSISRPVFQLRDWEILSPGNSGLKSEKVAWIRDPGTASLCSLYAYFPTCTIFYLCYPAAVCLTCKMPVVHTVTEQLPV